MKVGITVLKFCPEIKIVKIVNKKCFVIVEKFRIYDAEELTELSSNLAPGSTEGFFCQYKS